MNTIVRSRLQVTPVASASDISAFVELPFHLYAGDPVWVAPLRHDLRKRLDRRSNPFFDHARAAYFLARREGRVVGRISAHVDDRYNTFHAVGDEPASHRVLGVLRVRGRRRRGARSVRRRRDLARGSGDADDGRAGFVHAER